MTPCLLFPCSPASRAFLDCPMLYTDIYSGQISAHHQPCPAPYPSHSRTHHDSSRRPRVAAHAPPTICRSSAANAGAHAAPAPHTSGEPELSRATRSSALTGTGSENPRFSRPPQNQSGPPERTPTTIIRLEQPDSGFRASAPTTAADWSFRPFSRAKSALLRSFRPFVGGAIALDGRGELCNNSR